MDGDMDVNGGGPDGGGRLAISGEGVMMAALRERDGRLEVRLVAEHPTATEAVIRGDFTAAWTAGVPGSPLSPLEVSRVELLGDKLFGDAPFPCEGADGRGPAESTAAAGSPSDPGAPDSPGAASYTGSPRSWRTVRVPLTPFEIATVHLGRA
jgi:alpha-mannosidase